MKSCGSKANMSCHMDFTCIAAPSPCTAIPTISIPCQNGACFTSPLPRVQSGHAGGGCHSYWCFVCLGVCVCVFTTPMSLKVVSIDCPKCPLLCLLIPSSKQTWKPLISLLFPLWFVMQDLFSCAVFICASLIQLGQPAGKLQESPVSVPPVLGIWMQVLELA